MSVLVLTPSSARVSVEAASTGARGEVDTIAESIGAIILDRVQTRVVLKRAVIKGTEGQSLPARVDALAPGRRIYLVLRDFRVVDQPGVLYRLYLDLPPGRKPTRADPLHVIGTFNLFNAYETDDLAAPLAENSKFFSYDITDLVRNLQTRNLLCAETTVTIIPSGTPAAGSKASIGRIELIEQ